MMTAFELIEANGLTLHGDIEHFAELIRADEREACAKVVEPTEEHRRDASWGYVCGTEGVELLDGMAAAIRARSNT